MSAHRTFGETYGDERRQRKQELEAAEHCAQRGDWREALFFIARACGGALGNIERHVTPKDRP